MIQTKKKFALIGLAGYVAPRHLKAIQETGNILVAAYDPSDSVGIIDRYFPQASFFTEYERFDRHLEKLRLEGEGIDYLVICSPNYLHDAHCRLGLRLGAEVICEKPVVLNPWNLDALQKLEQEYGSHIWSILQLRLHPESRRLRDFVKQSREKLQVDLTYITSRGHWYYSSWKSEKAKSGGIATNIGIHLFDLLCWMFGEVKQLSLHRHSHDRAAGVLEFENARVKWFLSIQEETLPEHIRNKGQRTFRSLRIGEEHFDFSTGFEDLHLETYQRILMGKGFSLEDCRPSIALCAEIRSRLPQLEKEEDMHPMARLEQTPHPFGGR